jgi:hypothetical protein
MNRVTHAPPRRAQGSQISNQKCRMLAMGRLCQPVKWRDATMPLSDCQHAHHHAH